MSDLGYPARGKVFIRHVETEENYRGGSILIPEKIRDKVANTQFLVVSVGDYARCEDIDECNRRRHTKRGEHPHDLMEGDWILVKLRSWSQTPDPHVYIINQDDVLGKFVER